MTDPMGDQDRTAVLVVDLQQVFSDPGSPWAVPGFDAALAGAQRLLSAYDACALTRFVPPVDPPGPTGAWVDYYEQWEFARDGASPLWELAPGLAPFDAPVVDATTMGKWSPTTAAALGHPGTVLLAGVATECCVLATALAAADDGVRVRLVADACAGGSPADHDATLRVLAAFDPLVQVVTLADVC